MSRDWFYELQLGMSSSLRECFDASVAVCAVFGFQICAAPNESFLVFDSEGIQHELHDLASLREHVSDLGGLFTLRKKDSNYYASVSVSPATLRVSTNGTFRPGDEEYEADLQAIFLALITRLHPLYAYSTDELTFEQEFGERKDEQWCMSERSDVLRSAPRVLWWLNYFDADYYAEIAPQLSSTGPISPERVDGGFIVRLSDSAWDAPTARLGEDGRYHQEPA